MEWATTRREIIVEANKLADLVLLKANPLQDIRHTQRGRRTHVLG